MSTTRTTKPTAEVATGHVVPVGAVDDPTTLDKAELTRWLSGEDLPQQGNTEESDYAMALKILGAGTIEEAIRPDDVRKSETMVGQVFTILDAGWRRSTKAEADRPTRYAFLSCVDADGERFLMSCGATQVVLMLARLLRDDALPARMTLVATKTNSGNTMLALEPPDTDF